MQEHLSDRVSALENKSIVNKALPSDAEIDRSISIMEKMMKSFMGVVRQFQEDEKTAPLPQKT